MLAMGPRKMQGESAELTLEDGRGQGAGMSAWFALSPWGCIRDGGVGGCPLTPSDASSTFWT